MIRRLNALGAHDTDLVDGLAYLRPATPFTVEAGASFAGLAADNRPTLVVVDGVTEAMALHGLNSYENGDVARWWPQIPRLFARTGAAVVLVDHVVKDRETRGRWALGAGHKMAAIDGAAFTFDLTRPFAREAVGTARITISKDRPGHLRQHARAGFIAEFRRESWPDGKVTATLEPRRRFPADRAHGEDLPLHRGASRHVQRGVLAAVPGDDKAKALAIEILPVEGSITVEKHGQTHQHVSVTPFRNEDQ